MFSENIAHGALQKGTVYIYLLVFFNFQSFVNVVKYKLDHMRKKLEMEERDQTSRASFICNYCQRAYTDLEVGFVLNTTPSNVPIIMSFVSLIFTRYTAEYTNQNFQYIKVQTL